MALYGEISVNKKALQRWVDTLSADNIDTIEIGGEYFENTDETKEILKLQLSRFSSLIHNLNESDDWRQALYSLSPFGVNAFLKVKNGAIRIANFYECLLIPANSKTYKKIIKGYDYLDIGEVKIYNGTIPVASIGKKSDLIWQVFYDYFINQSETGETTHTFKP